MGGSRRSAGLTIGVLVAMLAASTACGSGTTSSGEVGDAATAGDTLSDATVEVRLEPEPEVVAEATCAEGMVYVRPGSFRMGCPGTEAVGCEGPGAESGCERDEGPAHDVTLSGFCLDRTEVTVAAYQACVVGGPCAQPRYMHAHCNWGEQAPRPGKEQHPVNCVSWVDADVYCRWRTGCEGVGCGLPSEAQWEFAARGRGASPRLYPWGEAAPDCSFANFGEYAEVSGEGQCVGETVPVCSTPKGNTPGTDFCDLGGNVWELTRDYYLESFYCQPEALGLDPLNTTESELTEEWPGEIPASPKRAVRGGSWYDDYMEDYLRGSKRDYYGELDHASTLGFRCLAPPMGAPSE